MSLQDKRSIVATHTHHHALGIPLMELEPDAKGPTYPFDPGYIPLPQVEVPTPPPVLDVTVLAMQLDRVVFELRGLRADLASRTWAARWQRFTAWTVRIWRKVERIFP